MNENANVTETQVEGQVAQTYTREEVDRMIQAEADRRVTEAIKTQNKKTEQKIAEAIRVAQMNEQEKYEYQLKQREEAITAKERELNLAYCRHKADKLLAEKGIDLALVDLVVSDNEDTMKANIDMLDTVFQASVKAEVEKRLASKTPRQYAPIDTEITPEQFRKMSIAELSHLAQTNPGVYNKLTNSK